MDYDISGNKKDGTKLDYSNNTAHYSFMKCTSQVFTEVRCLGILVCITTQIVALRSSWIQNIETEESSRYISVKSPFAQATGRGAGRAKEVAGHRAFLCQRVIPRGPPWSDLGRKVQDDSAPCETWALMNQVQRAQDPHVGAEACRERLSGVSQPPPDSKHIGQQIDAWDPSSCFPCGARDLKDERLY